MAKTISLHDPKFECLKDTVRLVKARIKKDAQVSVSCFYADNVAHINFSPLMVVHGIQGAGDVRTEPGVPLEKLVPENIGPMAHWAVQQVRKKRPKWFVEGEVVEL